MKIKYAIAAAAACLLLTSCDGGLESSSEQSSNESALDSEGSSSVGEESSQPLPEESDLDDNCNAFIERFAISESNPYMPSAIEYEIDGENGILYVNINYDNYADIFTLQNCVLDISVSGGEYSFDKSALNPDGTVDLTRLEDIILTDSEGVKRKYLVKTERTVFDLPIINIYLDDMQSVDSIDRYEYSRMSFYIDASGSEEFSSTAVMSGKIRGRGNSTWKWEKKPYKIKLDKAESVLGLEKNKDWILLSNYCDKTLLRNTVAYRMGRLLDGLSWTPTQYPADLFVNGEYRGVYSIGEHMEVAKSRVDIDENSPDEDTGYLLEIGGSKSGDVAGVDYFSSEMGLAKFIVIKSPEKNAITAEQRAFIEDYVNRAERAIVSGEGYEEYIDTDSFCDWIIIHELCYNLDSCFRRSCFMTKDKGGKLKMGPIWDFDLAFGNYVIDNPSYDDWATVGSGSSYNDSYVITNWCNYLLNNSRFRSKLRERWSEMRDDLLSEAMSCIDLYSKKLNRSQKENFELWQIMGIKVGYQSSQAASYDTYDSQIKYLKDFLNTRAEWIDKNI